jgi:hypothetical protein
MGLEPRVKRLLGFERKDGPSVGRVPLDPMGSHAGHSVTQLEEGSGQSLPR